MAEVATAILGATVQVVLQKALSSATDTVGLVHGFSKDLERLQQSVEMIRVVVENVVDKQSQSPPVKLWLRRLEEVAYKTYEVFDELNYENLRRKVKSNNQPTGKVCTFFFVSQDRHSISFRWRISQKVRDINIKLKTINQEAMRLGLTNRMEPHLYPTSTTTTGVAILDRETDSIVTPNVVGRNSDESKIVEMLLSSTENVVSILPIFGMGGIGKTTLAKLVFNNKRIQDHFTERIWVCVSDKKFEGTRVFKLILENLLERNVQLNSRNTIVQQIRKEVEGKRYLLVLDDVWNDNQESWCDFFDSLVGISTMSERSWCLVTCRRLTTSTIMATHNQYPLGKLLDDDCWSILRKKAVPSGEVPEELITIKEQVIKRCAGLPLAAKVLGSLLSVHRKEEWRLIVEKRLSYEDEDHGNNAMQILKLSFDYLPSPSIKKCFAYLSIFNKDTEMNKDDLIQLWMAEGFLQQDFRSKTTMEKIGDKYLAILVQSSLLEETRDFMGRVIYKLHDLVHDLAKLVSENETFVLEDDEIDIPYPVRYLALDSFGKIPKKSLIDLSTSVRTSFLKSTIGLSDEILSKFKNLHVLKLFDLESMDLPSSIGELKHIRYLDLQRFQNDTLPESLCKLYNLQTLRIGSLLQCLPGGMSNLISLRHLHYFAHDPKFLMPINMGRLTCIQTLQFFNIGKGKGRGIEELGCLEELGGTLCIRNLELVKGKGEAKQAKLCRKQNLIELEFCWGSEEGREGIHECHEHVLEGLQPHPNLEKLSIEKFMGEQFPQWLGNLSKLVRLDLKNCKSCVQLPSLHLPCLVYLRIRGFEKLSCIGAFIRIQRIEFLTISLCEALTSIASEILDCCASLKGLYVVGCPNLVSFPLDFRHTPSLSSLWLAKCPKLFTNKDNVPRGFGHLTSVKSLYIGPFVGNSSVELFDWSSLISSCSSTLHQLWLQGLGDKEDSILLNHLQHLTALIELHVRNFGLLEALPDWLGSLVSLEELLLFNCQKLQHLPSAPAMSRLTKLRGIYVNDCPVLEESLKRERGPESEWSKISHIPMIYINYDRLN